MPAYVAPSISPALYAGRSIWRYIYRHYPHGFLCPLARYAHLAAALFIIPALYAGVRLRLRQGASAPLFLKIPLFLLFYLHIPIFCSTFAPALPYRNDGQTTVKRRSSDSQSQRNLPVTPQTSPNLCTILYYIFYI